MTYREQHINTHAARLRAPQHARVIIYGLIALILLIASTADAHRINRRSGFYLGVSAASSSVDANAVAPQEITIAEDGGAIELRAGYLFNPKFSLEFALSGHGHQTSVDSLDAGVGTVHINAYYHFRGDKHFRPYIKGGLGVYGLGFEATDDIPTVSGPGLAFGAGLEYLISSHVSFGLDVTHHIINYSQSEETLGGGLTQRNDIDEDGTLTTVGLGMNIYF
jgi:outer membrane protein W